MRPGIAVFVALLVGIASSAAAPAGACACGVAVRADVTMRRVASLGRDQGEDDKIPAGLYVLDVAVLVLLVGRLLLTPAHACVREPPAHR